MSIDACQEHGDASMSRESDMHEKNIGLVRFQSMQYLTVM